MQYGTEKLKGTLELGKLGFEEYILKLFCSCIILYEKFETSRKVLVKL